MIQLLTQGSTRLCPVEPANDLPADVLWIDLLEPDRAEEARVEEFLGIDIPTREEMREIEESSRLYREHDSLYMTVRVLSGVETGRPRTRAITFVLTPRALVTVRYISPHAFRHFSERFTKDHAPAPESGAEVFVELLERIVDRSADVIEELEADLEHVSDVVFHESELGDAKKRKSTDGNGQAMDNKEEPLADTVDLQRLLKRLGRHSALAARLAREFAVHRTAAAFSLRHARQSAGGFAGKAHDPGS